MKAKAIIQNKLVAISIIIGMFSCGESINNEEASLTTLETTLNKTKSNLILKAYLEIKDALVVSDFSATQNGARQIIEIIDKDHDELAKVISENSLKILNTDDIEEQRLYFYSLSEDVYTLVKLTSNLKEPLYRQFCPMALDYNGAYWLSLDKEILNPYFGDKMLRCGSVKEQLSISNN